MLDIAKYAKKINSVKNLPNSKTIKYLKLECDTNFNK